jgi:hypothetical protein
MVADKGKRSSGKPALRSVRKTGISWEEMVLKVFRTFVAIIGRQSRHLGFTFLIRADRMTEVLAPDIEARSEKQILAMGLVSETFASKKLDQFLLFYCSRE